jgi:hypothetical protein
LVGSVGGACPRLEKLWPLLAERAPAALSVKEKVKKPVPAFPPLRHFPDGGGVYGGGLALG